MANPMFFSMSVTFFLNRKCFENVRWSSGSAVLKPTAAKSEYQLNHGTQQQQTDQLEQTHA